LSLSTHYDVVSAPLGLPHRRTAAPLSDEKAFQKWITSLYRTPWVVYAKRPFGGPKQVIQYPGRYTHRIAISHQRLLSLQNGRVTFA